MTILPSLSQRCEQTAGGGRVGILPVLALGQMPPSDGILNRDQLAQPEQMFPLEVGFCASCSLAQLLPTVPVEFLFLSSTYEKPASNFETPLRLISKSAICNFAARTGYNLPRVYRRRSTLGIQQNCGELKVQEK